MIVQCRKCATRYRFDENLIEGEGVLVRCSRCGDVFFQRPPELPENATSSGRITREQVDLDERTRQTGEGRGQEPPELDALPQEREDARLRTPADSPSGSGIAADPDDGEEGESHTDEEDYKPPPKISGEREKKRGFFGKLLLTLIICLVLATALGFVFYQLYPQQSRNLLQAITVQAPWIGQVLGLEDPSPPISHSLHFTDVRQRTEHNLIMGSVRIVEGTLTNNSRHYLARLQVKGEIFDSQGRLIGERAVFGGNILTDDELKNLAEADILEILKRPDGNAALNARVPPGGQVPFMLMFIRENPGATKTQVRVAGYERLP